MISFLHARAFGNYRPLREIFPFLYQRHFPGLPRVDLVRNGGENSKDVLVRNLIHAFHDENRQVIKEMSRKV